MSFSACKVPINNQLVAALDSFHQLIADPRFQKIPQEQQDLLFQEAMRVDRRAIRGYDSVNDRLANLLDGRPALSSQLAPEPDGSPDGASG